MSQISRVSWNSFISTFDWKQGEHLTAIAPTGAGKTTLFKHLLPKRKYNVFFGTKPDDKLYHQILREGYVRKESFDDIKPWENNILLWVKQRPTITETIDAQRAAFRSALNQIVIQKGWTVWIDEAKYLSQMLGLKEELTYCVEQLRSIDSTVICGAQRPAFLPPSVLAGSTHVFILKTTHRLDAEKLSDIGGIDARIVRDEARSLGKHEFIYIKSRGTTSHTIITQTPK